jgi:iron complex outermembrane receptor protein
VTFLALLPLIGPPIAAAAQGPAETAAATAPIPDGLQEIVVTARRREENVQSVPVSISAFSSQVLAERNVREVQDLNVIVPGFRFAGEGGKNITNVTLRGLSKVPLGEGISAVVTYFGNVPLSGEGTNIPTFDVSSIQVLKGPQGTLFGRNTLGGAIIVTPAAPSYQLGGYAQSSFGSFDYRSFEGALSIPIVTDKMAVRVAGQSRRQDGWIRNLSGGPDFNDLHDDSIRVSLLIEPFDGVRSLTIYDRLKADEGAAGFYFLRHNANVIPGLSGLFDQQIDEYLAGQRAAGFYTAYSDLSDAGSGRADRTLQGVSNDTSVTLGSVTLRNIFGYRKLFNEQLVLTGGTGPLTTPFGGFTLFQAQRLIDRQFLTEEFQALGTAFDKRLNWIVGAFYSNDKSNGPEGSNFKAFTFGASPGTFVTSHVDNKSTAIFAQGGLDLSDWVADGLTLNAGLRYTWDRVAACGGGTVAGYATTSECEAQAALELPDGVGALSVKGSRPSWTLGFDYKLDPSLLLYITSRRGYRGVNVNTPLFETPYTTGGIVVPPTLGGSGCTGAGNVCPDLRPFQTIGEETVTDVEIGAKSDWTLGSVDGRLNVAAYYSKYKNALQFFNVLGTGIYSSAPDLPTNQAVAINAADETIKGIEFDLTLMPTPDLTLTFNGAYTDAQVDRLAAPQLAGLFLDKGDVNLPSPKFSGTVGFGWTLPIAPLDGRLVLNADYFRTGKFGGQLREHLPGYDLVNARLSWNGIAGSGLNAAVFVRNLFKEKYFSGSSNLLPSFPTNVVISGEPRMLGAELRYQF